MRILVVGAGAVGGYFGARLLAAGRDVVFLVRPRRAEILARAGLRVISPCGDIDLPRPPTVTADALSGEFDLVLLSCKAYDLEQAMADFAPAVGPRTAILPLLNGMGHLDVLQRRFGPEKTLGGFCMISTTLDAEGRIVHLANAHLLVFGERDKTRGPRADAVSRDLSKAGFDSRLSANILQEMWDKWVFIATFSGITCLMRGAIGDVVAAGGAGYASALLDECAAIAAGSGFAPARATLDNFREMATAKGSLLTVSMMRDLENGSRIEADHMIGDLLQRAGDDGRAAPLLRLAYTHLKTYQARAARNAAGGAGAAV